MRLALKTVLVTTVLVTCAVLPVSSASPTIGAFVNATAERLGVTPATVEGMRSAGYAIPEMTWSARLTEADIVAIGAALGVSMQTQTPGAPVNDRRAQRYLGFLESRATRPQGSQESNSDPRHRPRSRSPRAPHSPHGPPSNG
jgi:hypothetical protein